VDDVRRQRREKRGKERSPKWARKPFFSFPKSSTVGGKDWKGGFSFRRARAKGEGKKGGPGQFFGEGFLPFPIYLLSTN